VVSGIWYVAGGRWGKSRCQVLPGFKTQVSRNGHARSKPCLPMSPAVQQKSMRIVGNPTLDGFPSIRGKPRMGAGIWIKEGES